jgi:hypothetical protein
MIKQTGNMSEIRSTQGEIKFRITFSSLNVNSGDNFSNDYEG